MTIEVKPNVDDFVVVVRLKTSTFGIPHIRDNREAFETAQKIAEQVKKHCDDVHDALICVESAGTLPQVGEWNKTDWE